MEKLLKPAEYAQQSGLSRQAIYAQIKNETLPSKKVGGRLYVIVKDQDESEKETQSVANLQGIIQSKDETIEVLQSSIKDLKQSNEGVIKTLQSEIELLKQAFLEMRGVYKEAITYTPQNKTVTQKKKSEFISLKKYCKKNGKKMKKSYIKQIKDRYKKGDKNIKKLDGKLYVSKQFNG